LFYDNVDLFAAVEHYDLDFVRSAFLEYAISTLRQGLDPHQGYQHPPHPVSWHPSSGCGICNQEDAQHRAHEHAKLADLHEHYLVRRIAQANVRRRQQFAYWKHRKSKRLRHTERESNLGQVSGPTRLELDLSGGITQGPAVFQSHSVTTATHLHPSLHTIDDITSAVSVSEYIPSKNTSDTEIILFPEAPQVPENDQYFDCPFCHITCARKTLKDRAWKAHLIHDLRPYMCTFRNCNSSDVLYDRMADWIHHENSQHRLNALQPNGSDEQPETLEATNQTCPICLLAFRDLSALQSHLALHLERLAAFSFPRSTPAQGDDDEEVGSDKPNFEQGSRDGDFDVAQLLSFDEDTTTRRGMPATDIQKAAGEAESEDSEDELVIYDTVEASTITTTPFNIEPMIKGTMDHEERHWASSVFINAPSTLIVDNNKGHRR
jgi:hypothetical protein